MICKRILNHRRNPRVWLKTQQNMALKSRQMRIAYQYIRRNGRSRFSVYRLRRSLHGSGRNIAAHNKLTSLLFSSLYTTYKTIKWESDTTQATVDKYFYTNKECQVTKPVQNLTELTSCKLSHDTCRFDPKLRVRLSASYFTSVKLGEWITYIHPLLYKKMVFMGNGGDMIHDIRDGTEYQRLLQRHNEIKASNGHHDRFDDHIDNWIRWGAVYSSNQKKSIWPVVHPDLTLQLARELPRNFLKPFDWSFVSIRIHCNGCSPLVNHNAQDH